MSTLTLPKVAAELNGSPFFAIHSVLNDNVLWTHQPRLPNASFRWATDSEVTTEHVTLDETTIAELLFVAPIVPDDDPTPRDIRSAVVIQLAKCHCRIGECVEQLAQEAGDHPEACADRMRWCLALASTLLEGEA